MLAFATFVNVVLNTSRRVAGRNVFVMTGKIKYPLSFNGVNIEGLLIKNAAIHLHRVSHAAAAPNVQVPSDWKSGSDGKGVVDFQHAGFTGACSVVINDKLLILHEAKLK